MTDKAIPPRLNGSASDFAFVTKEQARKNYQAHQKALDEAVKRLDKQQKPKK